MMTKSHSLLNAAILANKWENEISGTWLNLENIAEKCMSLTLKYTRGDISTWSDSAGTSMTVRVGDHHAVSYWDGEDMIFIYECSVDTDLSEAIGGDPICQIAL